MKHIKQTIALIAVLAVMTSCFGNVYAASGTDPLASPTLTAYAVKLAAGTKNGELRLTFDVTASGWADSLGVSYFEIYKASNDELVDTVRGSTSNGLKSSGTVYTYTYSYTGATPGVDYYAIVAVSAQIGTTYHSRTLTTSTVTAPKVP